MRFLRVLLLCLFATGFFFSNASIAQTAAPKALIVDKIDESQLVALQGNTLPAANAANDLGPVSPALPMTGLVLVLSRPAEQQAAFDAFVASQYDPASPNYHRWLEPADVGLKFGPSAADIATLCQWLAAHGFTVDELSSDRTSIRFSGTAAQVQSAFHTEIHNLSVNGEQHIANMSDPSLPAALAPALVGIKALHNFFPKPLHRLGSKVTFDPHTGKWQRATNLAKQATQPADLLSLPHPEFGINGGSSASLMEDVAPYDFATIYNVLPLWNAGVDGAGQTIAIAGTSNIDLDDIASFRATFGLPPNVPTVLFGNGTDPGNCPGGDSYCDDGLTENTLDVEWSGAVAKGAKIVLVASAATSSTDDTLYDAESYIVQNKIAPILNVSYGLCELFNTTAGNTLYNSLWQSAAAEGIAVFVSTGDSGSASCDDNMATSTPYPAQFGLSVSGLASTPYNTAVGGTDFNWGSTAAPYWSATNNSTTGANALGYVPEVPWNDTCANPLVWNYLGQWAAALQKAGYPATTPTDAPSACSFVESWYTVIATHTNPEVDISGLVNAVGGSGGASNCAVNTSNGLTTAGQCTSGYPKPTWQAGVTGIPADNARDIPDVSFLAANGLLGSAYLICVSANGACTYSPTSENVAQEVGGTSVASPAMAGVMALIDQWNGGSQGSPNAQLYKLASKQTYSSCSAQSVTTSGSCYFNDINTGTNTVPCAGGSPNCTLPKADTIGTLAGYSATAGYDEATGLGSLNVANVVNGWPSAQGGTAKANVSVLAPSASPAVNAALSVTVTVAGSGATPTGTVTLSSGSYSSSGTLSAGSYTFHIPAFGLNAGADTLLANYTGDATYGPQISTTRLTVIGLTPSVAASPFTTTLTTGNSLQLTATVTGSSPAPTGTVTLSGSGLSSAAPALTGTLSSGSFTFTVPPGGLNAGADSITVVYSGDAVYQPGNAIASVNVTKQTPQATVYTYSSQVGPGTIVDVQASVSGFGVAPTGSIQLSGGGYSANCPLPAVASTVGNCSFFIPAGTLSNGVDTLTAAYSGDSNYIAASATTTVSVSILTPVVSITPATSSITTGTSLQLAVKVAGSGVTPTGTVVLAGGGYQSQYQTLSAGTATIAIPAGMLNDGVDSLAVTYSGDGVYLAGSATASVTVTGPALLTPALTINLSPANAIVNQTLTVSGTLTGAGPTPSGTVTLSSASSSYTSPAATLSNGSYSFTIPANSLSIGMDAVNVAYSGDQNYFAVTSFAYVQVASINQAFVTVTPATSTVAPTQSLSVTAAVNGGGGTPTGSVQLSANGFVSPQQPLANGSYTFTIPANTLAVGVDSIFVTYSGDTTYYSTSASNTVNVVVPAFTLDASTPATIAPGGSASTTITVSSVGNYTGTVSLSCLLAASPAGASDLPSCSVASGSTITLGSSATTGTGTVSVTTTAASSAQATPPLGGWAGAGGGAILAFLLFLGMPARRRSWLSMLGLLALAMALGCLSACSSAATEKKVVPGNPGTTPGRYTFTVTGTGNPAETPTPTASFVVNVN